VVPVSTVSSAAVKSCSEFASPYHAFGTAYERLVPFSALQLQQQGVPVGMPFFVQPGDGGIQFLSDANQYVIVEACIGSPYPQPIS